MMLLGGEMAGFAKRGIKGGNLQVLNRNEINHIHEKSLELLQESGIVIRDAEMVQLLGKAGCKIDEEINLVKIPRGLVEDSVDNAPSSVTLCGRESKYDMCLGDGKLYARIPGGATHILDLDTHKRREATINDLESCARVSNALPNIHGFSMFQVTPQDVPAGDLDVYAAFTSFSNTEKHLFYVCHNDNRIEDVIDMAVLAAGGEEALKERPLISALCEATTPRQFVESQMKVLKSFASRGLPLMLHSHPIAGFTSPVTLAGELLMTNIEVLSLVVMSQVINPRTPVVYGMSSSIPDMSTSLNLAGGVEIGLLGSGVAQLAQHYGIPSAMSSGIDSKIPDAQASMERIMTVLPPILAGIDMVNLSTTESKLTFSIEQLVIDNELMSWIGRYLRGIEVDEGRLAVDLIKEVGPGGHFMDKDHTVEYFKEELMTEGLIRGRAREGEELAEMQQRAGNKVRNILKEDPPKYLGGELYKKMSSFKKAV